MIEQESSPMMSRPDISLTQTIASFCSPLDLHQLARVNKAWHVSLQKHLKRSYDESHYYLPADQAEQISKMKPKEAEHIYKEQYEVERIWKEGDLSLSKQFVGHTAAVRCFCLAGNTLISGSKDATIRIWDIEKAKPLLTLTGHTGPITALAVEGDVIVSASEDLTIRIWKKETGELLHTLSGHTRLITGLEVTDSFIFSSSLDGRIKEWDIHSGKCVKTFSHLTNQDPPLCLKLFNNHLYTGTSQGNVFFWDLNQDKPFSALEKHKSSILSLKISGNRLFVASEDGEIKVWDLVKGSLLHTFKLDVSFRSMDIVDGRLLIGTYDGQILVLNAKTGKLLRKADDQLIVSCVKGMEELSGEEKPWALLFRSGHWNGKIEMLRCMILEKSSSASKDGCNLI